MPELPDVEGFRMYLDSTALRQKITGAHVRDARILEEGISAGVLGRRLVGGSLRETRRHGKLVFARISAGGWLVFHFGMTGELVYGEMEGEEPRHTRVSIEFARGTRLAYLSRRMLGRVGLCEDVDGYIEEHGLGPDALDERLTLTRFRKLMAGRRGTLKGVLLDQSLVAGIGNEWGDEILFQAGLDPQRRSDELSDEEVAAIHRAMRTALKRGAANGGDVDALPGSWLLPHRRPGGECPRCGGALRTVKVSGRTSYFCPRCQPSGA